MEEYQLPNGLLEFDPVKHVYTYNDMRIPSVTGIVRAPFNNVEALMGWTAKLCGEYLAEHAKTLDVTDPVEVEEFAREMKRERFRQRDKAGDIGTMVHQYAELYLRAKFIGGPYPALPGNEKVRRGCAAFSEWAEGHAITVHSLEGKCLHTGANGLWSYAGTYDADLTVDGKRTLLDWKTSARFSPSMMAQLGGYDQAIAEMDPGIEFEQHTVCRFDRDTGKSEIITSDAPDLNRSAFNAAMRLHKFAEVWKNGNNRS